MNTTTKHAGPSGEKTLAGPSGRKPYTPPSIIRTEIEVTEALMGFCKASGSGSIPSGCSLPCANPGS